MLKAFHEDWKKSLVVYDKLRKLSQQSVFHMTDCRIVWSSQMKLNFNLFQFNVIFARPFPRPSDVIASLVFHEELFREKCIRAKSSARVTYYMFQE